MTDRDPHAPVPATPSESEHSTGLRLRLWLACLSGALVTALGLWWVAGTQVGLGSDPAQLLGWLAGIGGLGVVVGAGFALWLDHGIISHLRGLARGLASGRVQELRGLPAASGWGELSELTDWAQMLITRQRIASRAAADLEQLEAQIVRATEHIERWRLKERWDELPAGSGAGEALARELNASLTRADEIGEQNLEASRRVHADLVGASGDARESAEMAERGFVEATALLTTVRELQRLGIELRSALADAATPPPEPALEASRVDERFEAYRSAVDVALQELIGASDASIEHLGAALLRVQEIAAQVQLVSNRATLVALHAVTIEARLPREQRGGEELSHELRQLTAEVRGASQRADELAEEVEHNTRAAGERIHLLRDTVAVQLEAPPALPVVAPSPSSERARAADAESVTRLLERVREMIQDATQKGERLSSAGERASRAAERLMRRLEDQARDLGGLMVRLTPGGELPGASPAPPEETESRIAARLRLLEAAGEPAPENADPSAGPGVTAMGMAADSESHDPEAREELP